MLFTGISLPKLTYIQSIHIRVLAGNISYCWLKVSHTIYSNLKLNQHFNGKISDWMENFHHLQKPRETHIKTRAGTIIKYPIQNSCILLLPIFMDVKCVGMGHGSKYDAQPLNPYYDCLYIWKSTHLMESPSHRTQSSKP